MEKKQTVVASDALTKDQIRELAVKSLAGIKNSYAPYSHFHSSSDFTRMILKSGLQNSRITWRQTPQGAQ